MKLKVLAEAAAEFYQTPDLQTRSKPDKAQTKKARHVCQYLACDAGYHRSIVGRFWGMDRTSIYYGCQMVANRIDTDPAEKLELKRFMEVVRERFNA
tara:strand:- start:679 stop:969 length:291 start_codon:yes stop_codon:yes gene_type:complete